MSATADESALVAFETVVSDTARPATADTEGVAAALFALFDDATSALESWVICAENWSLR